MPHIHVCPLSKVPATVDATGARSLLTLINEGTEVVRPRGVPEERHLFVAMSDIVLAEDGHVLPAQTHVESIVAFARAWDRQDPMVIHCYAGVSRSTAAAFIATCALDPSRSEVEIAGEIRTRSRTATPNRLMVALADTLLGRGGRMVAAIEAIGRGTDCFEGVPFALEIDHCREAA